MSPSPALAYETDRRAPILGELAELAVKLLGIFCIVTALPVSEILVLWAFNLGPIMPLRMVMISLGPYAGDAAAGVVLIWRARWLAHKLVPSPGMRLEGLTLPMLELQAIAVSLLGLYFMVTAIPGIAQGIIMGQVRWPGLGAVSYGRAAIPGSVQFLAGLVLFLRAKGIAIIWHRLRSAGGASRPDA